MGLFIAMRDHASDIKSAIYYGYVGSILGEKKWPVIVFTAKTSV